MPTLSSRRRPWPWDMRVYLLQASKITSATQQNGMMLVVPQGGGLLVGKKQQNLGTNLPPVAAYDSAPVYKEHTFEFRPTGGFGESIQASRTDKRYHYAINCWMTAGLFGLGPLSHTITPPSTGSIRQFIEALGPSGALALFTLAGSYVLIRSDDSGSGQFVSRSRPGHTAMDAVRFTGAYASPVDGLYVTWDDGVLEEYNHSTNTWTACALPANFTPGFLCKVGDELWAADWLRSQIRKVTNDPKVAGSWSGPIQIGNQSCAITALRQTANRLCIFKSDGDIFTVNADGSDNDMFPGLQSTVDMENGRTAVAWQGSLWFRDGRAFWQLDVQGGFVLTPAGPGRALQNLGEVRGPVQCFAGWNSQLAFGVVYNESLNNSYLMTYGTWEPNQGDAGTSFQFVSQWDGALVRWVGKKATACFVSMIPYDARLYVGFSDGSIEWIKLVPYPLTPSSGGEYTRDEAYVVLPLHHDMFQADTKQLIGISVFGPLFPVGSRIDVAYRLRGSAGLVMYDPANTDYLPYPGSFTYNGQRIDSSDPIAAVAFDLKVNLQSTDLTTTPILEGVGIHERVVPAFRRDFTFSVDARDVVARRDGATMRQSGRWLRDFLIQAASMPAMIGIEFPDETLLNVAIFDYSERQVAHTQFGGQGWAIDCQATQFGINDVYGTIGRTRGNRIGDLRGWKISDLERF